MHGNMSDTFAEHNPCNNLAGSSRRSLKSRLDVATAARNPFDSGSNLRCQVVGCVYDRGFRSKHELRRHMLCVHDRMRKEERPFSCGALVCCKDGRKACFARADKLTAHIRNVHSKPTLFKCPEQGCRQSPLDGLDMFVHVQSHIESRDPGQNLLSKAVARAFSPAFPQCPFRQCRRVLPLNHVIDHLLDHGDETIRLNLAVLTKLNFLYAPSVEGEVATFDSAWTDPFMRIFILCPLCDLQVANYIDFRTHLIDVHMHSYSHHFRIWVAHVEETLITHGYTSLDASTGGTIRGLLCRATVWRAWRFVLLNSHTVDVQFRCPECNAIESISGSMTTVHHLSMLGCFAKLYPLRQEVLALCPQFASHPVFKDIHVSEQILEPHAFRLQKVSKSVTTRASAAGSRTDFAGVASAQRPMHDSTAMSHHEDHPQSTVNDGVVQKSFEVLTGIGSQFRDRMVGGGDELAASAISVEKADMYFSLSSDMPYLTTGRGDEGDRTLQTPFAIRQSDSHGKTHICGIAGCELRFERPSDLRLHQRAHIDSHERPYKCMTCGKKFLYPKDLLRHEKIH